MKKSIENYNPEMNGWKKLKQDYENTKVWEKLDKGRRVDVVILQEGLNSKWHFSSWKIKDKAFRNKYIAINFAKSYMKRK